MVAAAGPVAAGAIPTAAAMVIPRVATQDRAVPVVRAVGAATKQTVLVILFFPKRSYIRRMKSPYQSFIRSKIKQIFFVATGIAILCTITFFMASEVNVGFTLLWFFVTLALSTGFLLIVHSILYLLFGRHLKQ